MHQQVAGKLPPEAAAAAAVVAAHGAVASGESVPDGQRSCCWQALYLQQIQIQATVLESGQLWLYHNIRLCTECIGLH